MCLKSGSTCLTRCSDAEFSIWAWAARKSNTLCRIQSSGASGSDGMGCGAYQGLLSLQPSPVWVLGATPTTASSRKMPRRRIYGRGCSMKRCRVV